MKNKIKISIFLVSLFSLTFFQVNAQYCSPATATVAITPSGVNQVSAPFSTGFIAFSFTATAGCTYNFATCGLSSADTYLRLYSTGTGGVVLMTADDECGGQSTFTWTCPSSAAYSVLLSNWNCVSLTVPTSLSYSVSCPPPCAGTPNTGTATISSNSGCIGNVISLVGLGLTTDLGITYQWVNGPTALGPWTNIPGASATTYTVLSTIGATYYSLITTCTNSSLTNTTNVVSYNGVSCTSSVVPLTGSNTITCGTNTLLRDHAGIGNYLDNANGFTVLNNSGTGYISMSGTYTGIESCCDRIYIYSGAGTGGVLLYTYGGLSTASISSFTSAPGQILTVQFTSDGSLSGPGFDFDITYFNDVSFSAAPSPTICIGKTTTLTAIGAVNYSWIGGPSTSTFAVSPAVTSIYTVTGTGCAGTTPSTKTVTVYVNALPTVTITPAFPMICPGQTITLSAAATASVFVWSNAATSSVISVSPLSNTLYSVSVTNSNGCIGSSMVTLTVNAAPTVSVSSGAICAGYSYTMMPSGASTYTYSSGSAVVSPSANTSYSVTGTNSFGCISSNTAIITVTVNAIPTVTTSASNTSICIGQNIVLTATASVSSYTWNTGATTSITATPTITTVYTASATAINGCLGTSMITVTVDAGPTISASVSNPIICVGETAVLTVSTSAVSYTWNTGATTISTSVSPIITTSYSVNGTSALGCLSSSNVNVTVNACTGINEVTASLISVYPNPNNGIVNITLTTALAQNSTLEIYDALGKLVVKQVLVKELNTVNMSNLDNGIYVFKVLNNNNTVKIGKLIKQ